MTLTFYDNTTITIMEAHGRSVVHNGISRDMLVFVIDPSIIALDQIAEVFIPSQLISFKLTDDGGNVFVHENYTIRLEFGNGYRDQIISGAMTTVDQTLVTYVKMAQSTLAERTIMEHQEILDAMVVQALNGRG